MDAELNAGARAGLVEGHLGRALFRLAGPMLASALLQNAQSLIDLFWVGRLGKEAVAATAAAGTVLMLLFPLVLGMSMGTVAVVSRRIGEGDMDAASEAGAQSLWMAVVSGAAMGAIGWLFAGPLCGMLGIDASVRQLATGYLRISFAGGFSVFLLFIGNSILNAAGNAVIPMAAMILANVLNVVLDPLLIFGWLGFPRWGVAGAAVATVVSQCVAAAGVMVVLAGGMARRHIHVRHWRPRPAVGWLMLRIGLPGSGQLLLRSLMTLALMRLVSGCGTVAVAAYGIGMRILMVVIMPAFALGNASATIVGQCLGAGRPGRAARAAWLAAGCGVGLLVASAVVLTAWAPWFMRWFSVDPAVVEMGTALMRTVAWAQAFAALAIVLGRAMSGAGDTLAPMVLTLISLWGLQVPLATYLARVTEPATQGIWRAMAAAVTAHGLLVAAWFALGRWKRRKV